MTKFDLSRPAICRVFFCLLKYKNSKNIGIKIIISDYLLTNNIGNAILISSANKKAHPTSKSNVLLLKE